MLERSGCRGTLPKRDPLRTQSLKRLETPDFADLHERGNSHASGMFPRGARHRSHIVWNDADILRNANA
jgi:hypothetical protein